MASVALALAAPATVHAMCRSTEPFLAPATGSMLPPNPVIFLFVPEPLYGYAQVHMTIDVSSAGHAVTYQVEQISHNPAFTTYQISVAARADVELDVKVSFDLGGDPLRTSPQANYRVVETLPAAPRPERGLGDPEHEASQWECSYQSSWNLKPLVDAPAYRVEWAATLDDYRAGRRSFVVLPSHMDLFRRPLGQQTPGPATLELGHVDCMDHTLVWPGQDVRVGVWALLTDGGGIELTAEPIVLSKPNQAAPRLDRALIMLRE